MKYIELRQALNQFTIFSLSDIKRLDGAFYRRRLNEWQDKGYIQKLIKGYYIFSDMSIDENTLYEIANRMYAPSYVSFESALSYHGLIPESVYGITSVSTRRTYKFRTEIAEFSYRTLKTCLFFGYKIIKYNDKCFKMASPEKALLDYFYINPNIKNADDFKNVRVNKEVLLNKINKKKYSGFLNRFNKKALTSRMRIFWEVIDNA